MSKTLNMNERCFSIDYLNRIHIEGRLKAQHVKHLKHCLSQGEDVGGSAPLSTTLQTFTGSGAGCNDVNQWKRVRARPGKVLWICYLCGDGRNVLLLYLCSFSWLFRWSNRSNQRPATESSLGQRLETKRRWNNILVFTNCTFSIPGWNNCHRRCHIHRRVQVFE